MPSIRASFFLLVILGLMLRIGPVVAETDNQITPCGVASGSPARNGLVAVQWGAVVYDSDQGVCWLADANLAGDVQVRAKVALDAVNPDGSTPVINPDGTMDYETALNWVAALNKYNKGQGWLGHNNWQLPTTALLDPSCSSHNNGDFGVLCEGSALGHLYKIGLARTYPDSVVPQFFTFVWPFVDLQPGLYWAADQGEGDGRATFSFNTGLGGSNTTKYNFFHVLAMTSSALGSNPQGKGVLPYVWGPAAGKAVYDSNTGMSWLLDANLPAATDFGVKGTTTITSTIDGSTLTVPLIDKDGAVHFSAVDPDNTDPSTSWMAALNQHGVAGTSTWTLPKNKDLKQLYQDMRIEAGDPRLEWWGFVGPFWHFQPGFYWSCERDFGTEARAPCDPALFPSYSTDGKAKMEYSFNFDNGFEGTDLPSKQFYVMVYYPAPPAAQ